MKDRRREIQERIAKRRKMSEAKADGIWQSFDHQEEMHGFERVAAYDGSDPEKDHPLFKKEIFFFKILGAAVLFLLIAVMYKHPSSKLDSARSYVKETMNHDLQFAAISSWYEDKFGKPIAFLPKEDAAGDKKTIVSREEALPVTGKITESFQTNGEGIMLETGKDSEVEAIKEGTVTFAGEKANLGKTVIIQHSDKSESWYGGLENIQVKVYDAVKKGKEIGQVSPTEDGSKGTYYLAIRKNDAFIDPKKVITFE
ncbi:M23 family metallopeptidase [Bacillus sp. MUM 13]|uniref:M23 family metallopeptidase n=1 Tax=Bacillus sp. MUM 13 TaxID=1678001 RepID=UPI0008F5773A|nr:M23 family metallopeptidase [Bacillus sp. MUM 13]OIK14328.1 hypothetical protein BIV59_03495 [Bacillus sp. MUM 13]